MADDVFSNKFGLSLGLALMLAVAVFFMYGHSTMACAETQHLTGNILDQHDLIEHPKQVEKKTLDDSLPKLIQRERELENSIDNWTQKIKEMGDSLEKRLQKNKELEDSLDKLVKHRKELEELLDKLIRENKELKNSLAEAEDHYENRAADLRYANRSPFVWHRDSPVHPPWGPC
jgi:chromosome segregation ATPase